MQIINRNLHYGLVKAAKLTCEGVESNPGPHNYAVKKTIQTSHHQGHVSYVSNAYLVIIFLTVKKPFDHLIPIVEIQMDIMIQMKRQYFWKLVWLVY